MSWFFFSLLYVALASFSNVLRKIVLRDDKSDAVVSGIFFQFVGTVIVTLVAIWHGFIIPPIKQYLFNFFINASFWGLSTLCLFKAYKFIEASEVTILVTLESVVTIVVAEVFLHEAYSLLNMAGTVFILSAVIYLSTGSSKMTFNKGVIYALAYSFFAGIAIVNDTFMLKHADTFSYLSIGFLLPGLFIILVQPTALVRFGSFLKFTVFKKNLIFSVVFTIAAITFYLALSAGGQVAKVNTIAQAAVIVTVLLSILVLRERDHLLKKFVCAILVTVGVLLLR